MITNRIRTAALIALLMLSAASASAQPVKVPSQINLAIGSETGGGYDAYARLVQRHLGRFLPGNPSLIPMNMPGVSGLRMSNWLQNVAAKDGTVIAMPQNGNAYEPLLKHPQARFDPLQFNWLGSLNRVVNIVLVWHTTPYKTVDDLFQKQILLSGSPGADGTIFPNLLNDLIGTRFKVVTGYAGGNQSILAVMRGEVEGTVNMAWDSLKATKYDLITDKKVRILMQVAPKRFPELGDVPFVLDYVKVEENRRALELLMAKLEYGRPFAAPAGVPADLIALYREAFTKMTTDDAFLADAAKIRLEISPTTGTEMQEFISQIYKTPAAVVERARIALSKAGGAPQ